jgi:hypothetical protein
MRTIRWLLFVPSAALGYLWTFLCAMVLVGLLQGLCPPDLMISAMCTASWFRTAERVAIMFSLATGAALFVALPAAIAPAQRTAIAVGAFAIGFGIVLYMCMQLGTSFLPELVSATIGGGLMAALVRERDMHRATGERQRSFRKGQRP